MALDEAKFFTLVIGQLRMMAKECLKLFISRHICKRCFPLICSEKIFNRQLDIQLALRKIIVGAIYVTESSSQSTSQGHIECFENMGVLN